MGIPEEFWPLFIEKVKEEAAIYSPVSVNRLYAFMVARFPSNQVETILNRAAERGIIEVRVIEHKRGQRTATERNRFVELKENLK